MRAPARPSTACCFSRPLLASPTSSPSPETPPPPPLVPKLTPPLLPQGAGLLGFLWDSSAGVELRDAALQESWPGNGLGRATGPCPYLARFKVPLCVTVRSPSPKKGKCLLLCCEPEKPHPFALTLFIPGGPFTSELIQDGKERVMGRQGLPWGQKQIRPSGWLPNLTHIKITWGRFS